MFKKHPDKLWFFPVALLTIVFVLFGILSCRRTCEQFHSDKSSSLSYITSSLSDSLVFGNALSVEIASIPELKTLSTQNEMKGSCMSDLKTVFDTLVRTSDVNHMVESVYILFSRSGKVLTPETLYNQNTFYDREILEYCRENDLAFWYGCRSVQTGGLSYIRPAGVITIVRRIPFEVFPADDLVVVNLNVDDLLSEISHYEQVFLISDSGIVGSDGNTEKANSLREQLPQGLYGSKGTLALPGEYLYYQQLDSTSIYCAILTTTGQLFNACLPEMSILVLIYLASMLAFFFLMRLFSRITSRRSQDLIRKISDGTGSPIAPEHDPSAALDDVIDRLITSNRQMTESEKKYISLIQSTVIADIIHGHIGSEQKLEEHLAYCGLRFEHPYFTGFVCLTTIDDTNLETDATTAYSVTLFIKDLIERELSPNFRVYFHTSLDNRIYFFINHDITYETLNTLLKTSLHHINTLAQSNYDVSLLFFTGPCVDSLSKVSNSCYSAGRLSDAHMPSELINGGGDASSPREVPVHPTAIMEQLIGGFRKNSREMVRKGIDSYFDDYLMPAQLPLELAKNITCILANNILNEIWMGNRELHVDEMLAYLSGLSAVNTAEALRAKTESLLTTLFESRTAAALDSGNIVKYIPTVTEYIGNFYYKDLSIADIASCVDLNPRYLGELFKEATGKTLIQYLNEIRIDRAKRLLSETDAAIREIAEKVGYNGTHAFIRHFKALNNEITPSEYRDAHRAQ